MDFVFLSVDEPNAEKNFADLKRKVPWAKRVHGVKGFDTAHKKAAEISDTDRFIKLMGTKEFLVGLNALMGFYIHES